MDEAPVDETEHQTPQMDQYWRHTIVACISQLGVLGQQESPNETGTISNLDSKKNQSPSNLP